MFKDIKKYVGAELAFFVVFIVLGAFLWYSALHAVKGEDNFYTSYTPKIVWDGELLEKYRVDDTYFFVMRVGEEAKKLDNVAVNAYHNTNVGDDVSMMVHKESNDANVIAVIVIILTLATIYLADGGVVFIASMIIFAIAKWLDFEVTIWYVYINTIIAHSLVIFSLLQRKRIEHADYELETDKFFLFVTQPKPNMAIKWFGFVHVVNGKVYTNEADAVTAKLKGN